LSDLEQINELVESHIPLFAIDTTDTDVVTRSFRDYGKATGTSIFMWKPAIGLCGIESDACIPDTKEPACVLEYILTSKKFGIYLLCQFPAWLPHTDIEIQLRSLGDCQGNSAHTVFLVGKSGTITPGLRQHCYHLRFTNP